MLNKDQVIAYVGTHAKEYNIDPAALLSVALGEGLNTKPGSTWIADPSEPYKSFGPPSWYGGGAGGTLMKFIGTNNPDVASAWSWSPDGLDYWMKIASQSSGVAGSTGLAAITNLVKNFERPAARYVSGNINNAQQAYAGMQAKIADLTTGGSSNDGSGQGNAIVPVPPSAIDRPGDSGVSGQPSASGGGTTSQDIKLADFGPIKIGVPSGFVLGMFGFGLLALGALLFIAGSKGPMQFADAT